MQCATSVGRLQAGSSFLAGDSLRPRRQQRCQQQQQAQRQPIMATAAPEKPSPLAREARPGPDGRFGIFGGRYVPETLIVALNELSAAYEEAKNDPAFQVRLRLPCSNLDHLNFSKMHIGDEWCSALAAGAPPVGAAAACSLATGAAWLPAPPGLCAQQAELEAQLKDYVGRPSPLYHADRLSEHYRRCLPAGSASWPGHSLPLSAALCTLLHAGCARAPVLWARRLHHAGRVAVLRLHCR